MTTRLATILAEIKRAEQAQPGYCQECEGVGYWDTKDFDMVPWGSTNVRMDTSEREPCEHCIGKGKCPKCGSPIVDLEDARRSISHCTNAECGNDINWDAVLPWHEHDYSGDYLERGDR